MLFCFAYTCGLPLLPAVFPASGARKGLAPLPVCDSYEVTNIDLPSEKVSEGNSTLE